MSDIWRKFRRFFIIKVLHADDTPHRIALGVALGVFIGFSPTIGFQMLLALAAASLFRANKAVCIPTVWISNPITMVPMYLACYQVGSWVLGGEPGDTHENPVELLQSMSATAGASGWHRWLEWQAWKELLTSLPKLGMELWIGCLILGGVLGIVAYFATIWTVSHYRELRKKRKAEQFDRRMSRQRRIAKEIRSGELGQSSIVLTGGVSGRKSVEAPAGAGAPAPLILASSSPQRRALLAKAGFLFAVIAPPIDEPDFLNSDLSADAQAEALSYLKARSVAAELSEGVVIGADTIVTVGGRLFGKPDDREHAERILRSLMGTTHDVVTGVTILDVATSKRMIFHEATRVSMATMSPEALSAYLDSEAWRGKAGAYGVQDEHDAMIEHIEGSYSNVAGLPMERIVSMLAEWGVLAGTREPQQASRQPA